MHSFDDAGVTVYALSYDEADALRDFRDAHGITFNLLSDPDSEVIRAFGLLNTLISEDDHPWFGIPYPGTYVLDATGEITHKFFDSNLAVRAGPEQLLRAVQGEEVALNPINTSEKTASGDVHFDVRFDGSAIAPTVQKDLVVTLKVPAGRHVYAQPAPSGSIAVDISLDDNEALVQRAILRPSSELHQLAGSGESFQVHHGQFQLRLPLTVNNAIGKATTLEISGTVRWQSCDDEVCDLPVSHRFELSVPVGRAPRPALFGQGRELEPNAAAHFEKMTKRRQ